MRATPHDARAISRHDSRPARFSSAYYARPIPRQVPGRLFTLEWAYTMRLHAFKWARMLQDDIIESYLMTRWRQKPTLFPARAYPASLTYTIDYTASISPVLLRRHATPAFQDTRRFICRSRFCAPRKCSRLSIYCRPIYANTSWGPQPQAPPMEPR